MIRTTAATLAAPVPPRSFHLVRMMPPQSFPAAASAGAHPPRASSPSGQDGLTCKRFPRSKMWRLAGIRRSKMWRLLGRQHPPPFCRSLASELDLDENRHWPIASWPPSAHVRQQVSSSVRKQIRLLLVDHSVTQLRAWSQECARADVTIFKAQDVDSALKVAKRENLTMAILELFLPDLEGPRLVRELKKLHPGIVVFVVSGYMTVMHAVECTKAGAEDCLKKPVSCMQLMHRLEGRASPSDSVRRVATFDQLEREHIARVLKDNGGNVTKAAAALQIRRHSLQRKIKKLNPGAQHFGRVGRRGRVRRLSGARLRALNEALQMITLAFYETTPELRRTMAEHALESSPDCVDAYVILAEGERDRAAAASLLEKAVEVGEQLLGSKFLAKYEGDYWAECEARPYLRARVALARCLWDAGQGESALDHYREVLRLNPPDNLGVRYALAECLIHLDRSQALNDLAREHRDDVAGEVLRRRNLRGRGKQ
jgi:ActR/RegA family two-component response regulator